VLRSAANLRVLQKPVLRARLAPWCRPARLKMSQPAAQHPAPARPRPQNTYLKGGKIPMKNLKKVLSLVLALAMAFSLMSVALAADKATDFTDYGDIEYQEAVNVLTSIGVINGVDDGNSFNPTGTLTREQGAKIIT
jgi:hypothetical protein